MSSNRLSWLIFYRFNVSIIPFLESNILEIIKFQNGHANVKTISCFQAGFAYVAAYKDKNALAR